MFGGCNVWGHDYGIVFFFQQVLCASTYINKTAINREYPLHPKTTFVNEASFVGTSN